MNGIVVTMLFTHFLLGRLCVLEKATRGYGNCISERALFATLAEQGMPAEDFPVLLEWGMINNLLIPHETNSGRRFLVDRNCLARLRAKANGESPSTVTPGGNDSSGAQSSRDRDRTP